MDLRLVPTGGRTAMCCHQRALFLVFSPQSPLERRLDSALACDRLLDLPLPGTSEADSRSSGGHSCGPCDSLPGYYLSVAQQLVGVRADAFGRNRDRGRPIGLDATAAGPLTSGVGQLG